MLLRASVEFFSSWGMELLVTQLHDHNKAVSMEALDILDEACEDKVTACKHCPVRTDQRNFFSVLFQFGIPHSLSLAVKTSEWCLSDPLSVLTWYVLLVHRPTSTL